MIVDQTGDKAMVGTTEMTFTEVTPEDQKMNAELDSGIEMIPLQIRGVHDGVNQHGLSHLHITLEAEQKQVTEGEGSMRGQQSKYKEDALQQLCLLYKDTAGNMLQGKKEPLQTSDMNEDNSGDGERYEEGTTIKGSNETLQTSLKYQIDRVLGRVEEAMAEMQESDSNKRVKRTIETSAAEVKNMAMQLGGEENVEGMLKKDEAVVVFVSSENSGESSDKKRKRRGKMMIQGGAVASRLRKKGDVGVKVGAAVVGNSSPSKKRRARMAVRKVKSSVIKANTSLTLAPPTLGLPTP